MTLANEENLAALKRRRRIAEAYVLEYEHGNTTLTDLSKRYEVDRKTLYNWVNYDREFYELLLEARIKIGNSICDIEYTNLRSQVLEYNKMLKEKLPPKIKMEILQQIAKLSNLYSEKSYEQTQRERPQGIKKRLRDKMLAILENICSFDPEEFEKNAPPSPKLPDDKERT